MPRIRVNGVSLHYEEQGDGVPILCIHGAGSSGAVWASAARELGRHGRAIVYDRRGSHRSERPEPYETDLRQQAEDAAALLEALDAAPAIVIGRSYGGEVAIELALRRPESVRALAVLEAGESLTDGGRRWLGELGERVEAAAAEDVGTVGELVLREVLGDEGWEQAPALLKDLFVGNGPAIAAEFRGGFLDVPLEELRRIDCPVLLVGAEDSPRVFAEAIELLAGTLPSARVARVGGGHLIDPADPSVLAFVDEVAAQAASR